MASRDDGGMRRVHPSALPAVAGRGGPATPRPAPVRRPARRPPVRPRGRRHDPRRRRDRLRDVGHPRRRRRQRHPRLPRPHRRQPRRRPARRRATPPPGWWDAADRPGPGPRHRPLLRRLRQRPRRLPGHHRAGPPAPRRRPAVGQPLPGRLDPRHGAHPGRRGRPRSASQPVAHGHRRLDGRHAGARVGGDVPRAGAVAHPHRHLRRRHRPADRVVVAPGRRIIRLDPRWRGGDYYDAARRRRPHRGPRPGPHDQPDHLPHRRRLHRPLRPRRRRAARGRLRAVAALRGRALPRVPRRQARPPLRRQQLPAAHQGHGPARPRAGAGAASTAAWPATGGRCSPMGVSSDVLYPAYQSREIVDLAPGRRRRRPSTSRSTAPTATTPSSSRSTRSARRSTSSSPGSETTERDRPTTTCRRRRSTRGRSPAGRRPLRRRRWRRCCSRRPPTRSSTSTTTARMAATARPIALLLALRQPDGPGLRGRRRRRSRAPRRRWRSRRAWPAVTAVVLGLCSPGDHVVATRQLFSVTAALFEMHLPRLRHRRHVRRRHRHRRHRRRLRREADPAAVRRDAGQPAAVARRPRRRRRHPGPDQGGRLAPSPRRWCQQPLQHGVDLVLHSATKGIGGPQRRPARRDRRRAGADRRRLGVALGHGRARRRRSTPGTACGASARWACGCASSATSALRLAALPRGPPGGRVGVSYPGLDIAPPARPGQAADDRRRRA